MVNGDVGDGFTGYLEGRVGISVSRDGTPPSQEMDGQDVISKKTTPLVN